MSVTGGQQAHRPTGPENKENSLQASPAQPSPVTGEAGDPQTHAPRKGERGKDREIAEGSIKQNSSDVLMENINLLRMISEC